MCTHKTTTITTCVMFNVNSYIDVTLSKWPVTVGISGAPNNNYSRATFEIPTRNGNRNKHSFSCFVPAKHTNTLNYPRAMFRVSLFRRSKQEHSELGFASDISGLCVFVSYHRSLEVHNLLYANYGCFGFNSPSLSPSRLEAWGVIFIDVFRSV